MRRFTQIALITFFALAPIPGSSQTFPVRVTPFLTPPYSPFLTDYIDPGAERLTVQIVLNDLTVSEFRTKLRLTIEGVGITITTNPNYIPPPLTLQGGVPQLIYGSDIADYFKISNLVFQGLNPNELQNNGGRLPEGVYRISIEVLDYNRNTVVSNKGSATAWMILNDPPFINLPVNNAKLKPLNPQNIVFQWTPRHRGSPNAAFTTEYDVKMVEIWPTGRNPFDAINTSRPIFEMTTNATMLVYGPAETPLVLGREYALQVRARDPDGRDVFKNNGYSEVVRFIYGDECPMPTSLDADDIGTAKARVRWQGNGQNSGYLIKLREKKDGARWFEERTEQAYHNIINLKPGATYEYQLEGECQPTVGGDIFVSQESAIRTFTTLTENPDAFVCSDPNAVPPSDGSPPLRALFTNDFIKAGGFDVVVTKATGVNGRFTGEGLAVVPWFNNAKVKVTFKDIFVNSSYQLTGGEIKSVWDPNSRFLVEAEKTLAEGGGKGVNEEVVFFEADTMLVIPGAILSAYLNPTTKDIVLETNEGQVVIPREEGKTYAISDETGNGYLVDEKGNITKTTATDAAIAGAKGEREYSTNPDLQIAFRKTEQTMFGLDEHQNVLSPNYQQTENGKYVSWKALATGQTDEVAAIALGNGDVTKASFKTALDNQNLVPNVSMPNTQVLKITGKSDGIIDELLALYPNPDTTKNELVAGKLNLISYNLERRNLVLVSVNGTEASGLSNLQGRLNEIFAQGVVEWYVAPMENITVRNVDEANLDDGGSGLLSNYTEDMKKILREYTSAHALQEKTYYLFLVKNASSKTKLGYMPRNKQAGFIFVDAHQGEDILQTIAHELGHGAFHLKHTFSEYSLSQGVTENLMDYPARHRLDKWQWDKIHNPERVLGLFEDDDEGGLKYDCPRWFSTSVDCENVGRVLEIIKYAVKGQNTLTINWNSGKAEFVADNIELDGVRYDRIKIINSIQKEGEVTFDPRKYEDLSEDIVMLDGKVDHRRGFMFKTDTQGLLPLSYSEVITVLLYQNMDFENKLESLKRYLFAEAAGNNVDNLGIQRAEIANRIDASDTRFYGRFVESDGRLTDKYVDCAEFVYEVLVEQKFLGFPSGDCGDQSRWYKNREGDKLCVTSSNVSQIGVGDIVLWTGTWEDAKEYAHTGIVVQRSENSIHIVNAGQQGCECDVKWKTYKVKNDEGIDVQLYETKEDCYTNLCKNPAIWRSTSYFKASTLNSKHHVFKYWARPKMNK